MRARAVQNLSLLPIFHGTMKGYGVPMKPLRKNLGYIVLTQTSSTLSPMTMRRKSNKEKCAIFSKNRRGQIFPHDFYFKEND